MKIPRLLWCAGIAIVLYYMASSGPMRKSILELIQEVIKEGR